MTHTQLKHVSVLLVILNAIFITSIPYVYHGSSGDMFWLYLVTILDWVFVLLAIFTKYKRGDDR